MTNSLRFIDVSGWYLLAGVNGETLNNTFQSYMRYDNTIFKINYAFVAKNNNLPDLSGTAAKPPGMFTVDDWQAIDPSNQPLSHNIGVWANINIIDLGSSEPQPEPEPEPETEVQSNKLKINTEDINNGSFKSRLIYIKNPEIIPSGYYLYLFQLYFNTTTNFVATATDIKNPALSSISAPYSNSYPQNEITTSGLFGATTNYYSIWKTHTDNLITVGASKSPNTGYYYIQTNSEAFQIANKRLFRYLDIAIENKTPYYIEHFNTNKFYILELLISSTSSLDDIDTININNQIVFRNESGDELYFKIDDNTLEFL